MDQINLEYINKDIPEAIVKKDNFGGDYCFIPHDVLIVKKTIKFKGKQHYGVFEHLPFNKGKEGYAEFVPKSGSFEKKSKAISFMKLNSKNI